MNWRYYKIAYYKFKRDGGFLHASALTFDTLFAIVPILATAFAVAKGFGLQEYLNQQLDKTFSGQEEMINALSQYAQNLLAHTSSGVIIGVALGVLFYSVYVILNHIEETFNLIWQVPFRRRLSVRVNQYLALILAAPLVLVSAGSVKVFITQQVENNSLLLLATGHLVSLLLFVLLFFWLFKVVPNTRVERKTAFYGGLQIGVAFVIMQSVLIHSQILMTNYGPIYGNLAAFPIFLIWLLATWLLIIYGAQLCFVYQNRLEHNWQIDINKLSYNKKLELMLNICNVCIENFKQNLPPLSIANIAEKINLPCCCVLQLVMHLIAAKVLVETRTGEHFEYGYMPAVNAELLDTHTIVAAINSTALDGESEV